MLFRSIEKTKRREDCDVLINEIYEVREEKQKALAAAADQKEIQKRIEMMNSYLDGVSTEITEYDESMVRAYFDKITVFDDHYDVTFKSGISLRIEK